MQSSPSNVHTFHTVNKHLNIRELHGRHRCEQTIASHTDGSPAIQLSLFAKTIRAYKIYLYVWTSQNREFVFIAMLSTSPMVRAYIMYPEMSRAGLGFFKRRSDA
ncbi:uncharacterized protein N7496_010676 [Penicillium cataractarum]|uniref:Uncharacterized protein n=1 Tax=Penicillium cataractarum TaxID=2100454 RepID=A0A9W9RW79_9EURO|nr:uncharacterized protein N7496_010676 [Penicillium cataractarum]KAJ5364963.1 hypothetical protein N7496_010676 [Penicillium cataractarum]